MSIARWWEERLKDHFPIGCAGIDVSGYNIKPRQGAGNDRWPHAVARSALYQDYCAWFQCFVVVPLEELPQFKAAPEKLPQPKTDLEFYLAIKPWVYIDKDHQVKNYWVWHSKSYEGEWVRVKVRRWFIRLHPWEEHAGLFLQDTGVNVHASVGTYNHT